MPSLKIDTATIEDICKQPSSLEMVPSYDLAVIATSRYLLQSDLAKIRGLLIPSS